MTGTSTYGTDDSPEIRAAIVCFGELMIARSIMLWGKPDSGTIPKPILIRLLEL